MDFASSLLQPILLLICLGSLLVMMSIQNKGSYTPYSRLAMKVLFYACGVSAVLILGIVIHSIYYFFK